MAFKTTLCMLLLLAAVPCSHASPAYEKLCDDIIKHAQAASQFHNAQQPTEAEREVNRAIKAFEAARKLEPESPQAFANVANFFHNIQRFPEALEMWDETMARIEDKDMNAYLKSRRKFSEFGMYSVQRDKAYELGQGNVSAALEFARLQFAVYEMPEVLYDMATMEVMISEVEPSMEVAAREHFEQAQQLAFQAYVAGRKLRGDQCSSGRLVRSEQWASVLGDKLDILHAASSEPYGGTASAPEFVFRDGRVFLAHFSNVGLSGNDGIIVEQGRDRCGVFLSTAGAQENLHLNVQLAATWSPPPKGPLSFHDAYKGRFPQHGATLKTVRRLPKAVSLMQFTASAYYHFLIECMGRLALAREVLKEPDTFLIIPKDKKKSGFISQLLALFPEKIDPLKIINYNVDGNPDVRVVVDHLIYPSWEPVLDVVPTNQDTLPCNSLTPSSVLKLIRSTFVPSMPADKDLVIFVTRSREKMRKMVNEEALLERVRAVVGRTNLELMVFDGGNHPTADAIGFFARARAVVGVHGGALANTVFCDAGTLLIELGFRSIRSAHYAQIALALGFEYHSVHVEPSEKGLGAAFVELSSDQLLNVEHILATSLLPAARDDL